MISAKLTILIELILDLWIVLKLQVVFTDGDWTNVAILIDATLASLRWVCLHHLSLRLI